MGRPRMDRSFTYVPWARTHESKNSLWRKYRLRDTAERATGFHHSPKNERSEFSVVRPRSSRGGSPAAAQQISPPGSACAVLCGCIRVGSGLLRAESAPSGVQDAQEGLGVRRMACGEEHNLELLRHVLEERLCCGGMKGRSSGSGYGREGSGAGSRAKRRALSPGRTRTFTSCMSSCAGSGVRSVRRMVCAEASRRVGWRCGRLSCQGGRACQL